MLGGRRADGALVFTCNGRGTRHVPRARPRRKRADRPHWPAAHRQGSSPPARSGPVGGRNFLHGFTASLALFSDPQDPPAHMGENGASQLP